MFNSPTINTARLVVYLTAPQSAPLLEAAIVVILALYAHIEAKAKTSNDELLDLLDALNFRIVSERHERRIVMEDWDRRFQALASSIRIHADDKQSFAHVGRAKRVAAFREEIGYLCRSIEFASDEQ